MSVKYIAIIVLYGLICFFGSLMFVQCSSKSAQKQVDEAKAEVERAHVETEHFKTENEVLKDVIERTDKAVEKAATGVQEAQEANNERVEKLSDAPNDWLMCELPDSVQDMFRDYCD